MKRGTIEHAKMDRLAKCLNIPRYSAVGIMESLWHMTASKAPTGDISKLAAEDIAFYVQWDREPTELVEALIVCRWLDKGTNGNLYVHDWKEHAEDSVKKWLSRHGLKFADKSEQNAACLDMSGHGTPALALAVAPALAKEETASVRTPQSRRPGPQQSKPPKISWSPASGWENIAEEDRAAWVTAYPACDVKLQLARMTEWLKSNPAKAHKSNWRRFVVNWLTKSQERGGDAPRGVSNGTNTNRRDTETKPVLPPSDFSGPEFDGQEPF